MGAESTFDAEAICEDVSARVGLSDFGPDDFLPGLDALVETYRSAPLTEAGIAAKKRYLERLLTTRLLTSEAVKRFPEIRARRIDAPIYIVGAARTGTTFLHRMLAEATGVRVLLRWEGLHPAPTTGRGEDLDARRRAAVAEGRDPSFDAIREVKADLPEEDYLLLEPAMRFASGGEHFWEPFKTWTATADQRPAYEYLALLVRALDWQRSSGRWLMKSPAHLGNLGPLVEQFPDVQLVWTHRDPLEAVSSLCSLLHKGVSRVALLEPSEVGAAVAAGVEAQLARAMEARSRLGEHRFIDVDYRDLVGSPVRTAAAVARRAGLDDGPGLLSRLEDYARQHPQNLHGTHVHDLSDYGLDADELRDRFRPYSARFAVGRDG